MKKILFISEFDLNAQSSGCLHFFDIYTNAKLFADCTFLKVSNIYRHTNAFIDGEKVSVPKGRPLQCIQENYIYYNFTTSTYYDHEYNYPTDLERSIIINQIKFISSVDSKIIQKWILEKGYEKVVIFAHEPYSIFLANSLISKGLTLVPIVMDLPEMRVSLLNISKQTTKIINDSFMDLIKNAHAVLCASDSGIEILSIFTNKSKLFTAYSTFRRKFNQRLAKKIDIKARVKIALAGQVYAKDSLHKFLYEINEYTKSSELNIQFDLYGDSKAQQTFLAILKPINIDKKLKIGIFDYLPHNELQKRFEENYHIGYVPYPTDASLVNTVKYSFPSKFVSYIEAGLIPIYHGPRNSSVYRLLDQFDLTGLAIVSDESTSSFANLVNFIQNMPSESYIEMSKKFNQENLSVSLKAAFQ
ncbi:hypothetical protein KZZ10_10275 [Alcaligenaceae bacterium LF4-65]|uniref:Glycosyltransferase n=1 Tax=Zwartia hollandica TaxID=324606 RepID=A0A953ND45_9BURK|nr:hypothetical protein [Zwartia hollandica]MBZ1351031.1 hypothetical protein [Zwartia hollandica]